MGEELRLEDYLAENGRGRSRQWSRVVVDRFLIAKSSALEFLSWCNLTERITLIYLALLNGVILLFQDRLPIWLPHFVLHWVIGFAILLLVWGSSKTTHRALKFVRLWFPLALFIVFFEETEFLVHIISSQWFDWILLPFERAVFGAYPTVWFQGYATVWLTEYMNFAYASYFFLTPVLAAVFYVRKQWSKFHMLMLSTAIAYFICYGIFVLFPTEGPSHTLKHFHSVALEGRFFTALIDWIEGWGRVHGGAFPSAHVAGSFVVLLCAFKFERRLFWLLLPLILSLFVSTVYVRYHYVSDVLAGLLVGWVGTKIASLFHGSDSVD